mmetsp:Transcript_55302/g.152267  ORF Transcript_55302/g.152267 Transcript_55302/m.152267 type:complete len:200 (-) Transcript_55302:37-636(-)
MVVGKAKELGVPDLAPTLTPLGEKIGVTFESTLILAAAAIAAVGLLFLWITGLLKSLIPAASICWYMYKSIKALEEGEQAVTVYLMYWVVLYFLIIVEQVTNERTNGRPSPLRSGSVRLRPARGGVLCVHECQLAVRRAPLSYCCHIVTLCCTPAVAPRAHAHPNQTTTLQTVHDPPSERACLSDDAGRAPCRLRLASF